MTPTSLDTLDVTAWADLRAVPARMDELAAGLAEIATDAQQHVCDRAGFEPSPVCLLRPLAELMEALAEAFAQTERSFAQEWRTMTDGLAAATSDLASSDVSAAQRLRSA